MAASESDREEARSLLRAAHNDLRALYGMFDAQVFADGVFGFHAHQAVEKALKAWIASLGEEYPRTYDISLLLTLLQGLGNNTGAYLTLIDLNPFAVEFRYGPFDEFEAPLQRESVAAQVQELVSRIEALIG